MPANAVHDKREKNGNDREDHERIGILQHRPDCACNRDHRAKEETNADVTERSTCDKYVMNEIEANADGNADTNGQPQDFAVKCGKDACSIIVSFENLWPCEGTNGNGAGEVQEEQNYPKNVVAAVRCLHVFNKLLGDELVRGIPKLGVVGLVALLVLP